MLIVSASKTGSITGVTMTATSSDTSGLNLAFSGDTNVPLVKLTNTSDSAELMAFSITIGLLVRSFGYLTQPTNPDGGTSTITDGDTTNGGTRNELIGISFTDFDPGEMVTFFTDIDQDSSNTVRDYRNTLFNNGAGPNSVVTASFSDSTVLTFELPDQPAGQSSYSFNISAAPIPLPAGLPMLAAGLAALAWMRKRRS